MGDRVLIQVVAGHGKEFGPTLYCHWTGEEAPAVCERLAKRMADRPNDIGYATARLVQEAVGQCDGSLSFGVDNADKALTREDSPGDAGCILIHADKGYAWEPLCGYHRNKWLRGEWGEHHQRIHGKPAPAVTSEDED